MVSCGKIGYRKFTPRCAIIRRMSQRSKPVTTSSISLTKICNKCQQEFPATTEYFYADKEGKYGLRGQCKSCRGAYHNQYRESHREIICERSRQYHATHREQVLERMRDYRESNKEREHQRNWLYRQANKAKIQEREREWYKVNRQSKLKYCQANRERARKRDRQWRKANPDKIRVQYQRRRSREYAVPCKFSDADWQNCLNHFHGCCAYCGKQQDFWHVMEWEHYVPLSSPDCPGTIATNIVPACKSCNSSKRDKLPLDWLTDTFGKHKARQILERIQAYFDGLPI